MGGFCSCGHDETEHVHRKGACRLCACREFCAVVAGPNFHGGRNRNATAMVAALDALHTEGGLPRQAALIFSQLVLNLAGYRGRSGAERLIRQFLDAADVIDH